MVWIVQFISASCHAPVFETKSGAARVSNVDWIAALQPQWRSSEKVVLRVTGTAFPKLLQKRGLGQPRESLADTGAENSPYS